MQLAIWESLFPWVTRQNESQAKLANGSVNQMSSPHPSLSSPSRVKRQMPLFDWHKGPDIFSKVPDSKERVLVGAYRPSPLKYKNNQWQCPFHPAGLPCPATWHPLVIPIGASELRSVLLLSLATPTPCIYFGIFRAHSLYRSVATPAHLNMDLRAWLTLVSLLCFPNFERSSLFTMSDKR